MRTGPLTPEQVGDGCPPVERFVCTPGYVGLRLPVPPAYESSVRGALGYLAREVSSRPRGLAKRIRKAEAGLVAEWEAMHRAAGAYDEHEFAGYGTDCEVCGEGRCYWLHTDRPAGADSRDD